MRSRSSMLAVGAMAVVLVAVTHAQAPQPVNEYGAGVKAFRDGADEDLALH